MNAIVYLFRCSGCGVTFKAPETPEFSYGLFVMRTRESDWSAYLNAVEDSSFRESYELLKHNWLADGKSAAELGGLQQQVFGDVCDKHPRGESFAIGLLPKCPSCGSRRMESWEPLRPIQEWPLPSVTHETWDHLTPPEKRGVIDRALRQALQTTHREFPD